MGNGGSQCRGLYEHLRRPLWASWPEIDRRRWEKAVQPKDYVFNSGGSLSHLVERSVRLHAYHGNQAQQGMGDGAGLPHRRTARRNLDAGAGQILRNLSSRDRLR